MKTYNNIFTPQKSAFHTDIFSMVGRLKVTEAQLNALDNGVLLAGTPLVVNASSTNPVLDPEQGLWAIAADQTEALAPVAILASDVKLNSQDLNSGTLSLSVGAHIDAVVYIDAINNAWKALGNAPINPALFPAKIGGLTMYGPVTSRI
jgi:hypothetical protein